MPRRYECLDVGQGDHRRPRRAGAGGDRPAAHGGGARQLRARGCDHRHVDRGRRRRTGGTLMSTVTVKARPRCRRPLPLHAGDDQGPTYRKYKFAVKKIWDVDDLDFTQDAADWKRISRSSASGPARGHDPVPRRRAGGDRRARADDRRLPRAWPLRLGFTTHLPDGGGEDAEFFMRWHDEVAGVLEPEEVARHFRPRRDT